MAKIYVLDTETTGLTPPIGVVELAYIEVNEQLEALNVFDSLVDPRRPIEPGATGVHGITDEDVQGQDLLEQVLAPIAQEPIFVIGHNVQFDVNLVESHLQIEGQLCTLALARQYVIGPPNHKLSTLVEHLDLPVFDAHRALGDCYAALDLLRHILKLTGLGLTQVLQRQSKPRLLTVMPFGKHKGMPMVQVPADYRRWLLSQGSLDKDMRYTLEKLKDI